MKQTDTMRLLIEKLGRNEKKVCEAYAQLERNGDVKRKSNKHGLSAEQYARALWKDGERKGWF